MSTILFQLSCQLSQVESYVTTDGQSASLSWNNAPIWAYDQILITVRPSGFVDVGRFL
jgi:hypothetical protein